MGLCVKNRWEGAQKTESRWDCQARFSEAEPRNCSLRIMIVHKKARGSTLREFKCEIISDASKWISTSRNTQQNQTNEDRVNRCQSVHASERAKQNPLEFESGKYKIPWHGKHTGDIHKVCSNRIAYRKSQTKLRRKHQFHCCYCTRFTVVNYVSSSHWYLDNTVFLWKVKENVTGIWAISKIRKAESDRQSRYWWKGTNGRHIPSVYVSCGTSTLILSFLFLTLKQPKFQSHFLWLFI